MIPEIPTPITKLFETALARMGNRLPSLWAENKTQFLIAYSGGKDSSILVLFFKYLKEIYHIQTPTLFYLSHGIRSIETEEKELLQFLKSTEFPFHFVKKKSQICLSN
ncbi:PP-loop domain protein [Leptospira wolbachii serovar Codice str. CDC]|uniref:PP-loop domain protein n=1 Tax=Leptospira wolbachii serovar Codice str. CDC TaxID=1218599 RepID=R9A0D0_9LEPT|nr:ATP-binding protein [Leptospira wolbachii]EOQ95582.1 PP-loop domain protein [Leptospira wolbachii serovar Codice str. CDC]